MDYNPIPFRPNSTEPDTIPVDLNNANNDFTIIGQCFVNNDPTTAKAKDSDKLDGIDSSGFVQTNNIPTFIGGRDVSTGGKINLVKPLTTNLLSDISIDSYNSSNSSFRVCATNSKSQVSGHQINFEIFSKIYDVCLVDGSITETISTATESELNTVLNKYKYVTLPSNTTLTINLPSGVFNLTAPLTLPQLGGNTISLNGVAPTSYTITGAGSVTGSAGNWSVPITVSNASGINVGDYVGIDGSVTGTGSWYWIAGCWKVTAVSGNTVTVKNTAWFSSVPTFTLTGGALFKFNTVLKQTTLYTSGVILYNLHKVTLNNLAIVFDNDSGVGLQINNCSKVNINTVGIFGFDSSLTINEGTSNVTVFNFLMMCGAGTKGCVLYYGNNYIYGDVLITNGNGDTGFLFSGQCYYVTLISCANNYNGFRGYMCNAQFNNIIAKNNTASVDIYAVNQARIVIPSTAIFGAISPAVNTWGNVNSFIATY
jgi:hypothetical protein